MTQIEEDVYIAISPFGGNKFAAISGATMKELEDAFVTFVAIVQISNETQPFKLSHEPTADDIKNIWIREKIKNEKAK